DEGISSMVDTWMMVQDIEVNNVRTRSLCIMKSRGMPHSNEVKKFTISKNGIVLSHLDEEMELDKKINKRQKIEHKNLTTN
ncbi:MAG: ATPase domain-containing protein, partial [Flavisolibacter sp.]